MPPSDNSLRVAHIEMGAHLYGGAQQVLYLLETLPRLRIDSLLICPAGSAVGAAARERGLAVEAVPYSGDLDWRATGRIAEILRRHQIDLVHVHSRRGADIWGGLAARRVGLPCVLSRRVDNPESKWSAWVKYRLYARVIAISEGIATVLRHAGVPSAKIVCIRSAVDWQRFQSVVDRRSLASRFGLPDDAMVVGMAAQLIPRKGHDLMLEAVARLRSTWPSLHVLVMGKGPLAASLDESIRRGGLSDCIHRVGFLEDLEAVLPGLLFLVHPARTEGLGVALLQSASAGVAVIASDVGGMPEAVLHEKTGLLIPVDDVDALTAAMQRLLADPAQTQRYGEAGRERMRAEFSITAMAEGNARIYRELVAGGGQP